MKKKLDERIGIHGKVNPEVCAATGQFVNGRHNTTINLGDGFFCLVLNKARADKKAIKEEMKKLLPVKLTGKTKKVVEESNDK
ncbi:MAG: hypothetical protein ACYS80_16340 [Planctomycetota bacterium]|jgi:hypothetical protein